RVRHPRRAAAQPPPPGGGRPARRGVGRPVAIVLRASAGVSIGGSRGVAPWEGANIPLPGLRGSLPDVCRTPSAPVALTCETNRRGGRAVECAGLENRYGRLRPSRVRIPPSPLTRNGFPGPSFERGTPGAPDDLGHLWRGRALSCVVAAG